MAIKADQVIRDEIPGPLQPAVTAGAAAMVGFPADTLAGDSPAAREVRTAAALAILRAAVDARAIVPRDAYDDLQAELSQARGVAERLTMQMDKVGADRAAAERLCHVLAEALGSGLGVTEALAAYRNMVW